MDPDAFHLLDPDTIQNKIKLCSANIKIPYLLQLKNPMERNIDTVPKTVTIGNNVQINRTTDIPKY